MWSATAPPSIVRNTVVALLISYRAFFKYLVEKSRFICPSTTVENEKWWRLSSSEGIISLYLKKKLFQEFTFSSKSLVTGFDLVAGSQHISSLNLHTLFT